MAKSSYIALPRLSGTLVLPGPWQTMQSLEGYRVYPYQLGCAVRADSSGTAVLTHGMGEIDQNDYIMVCLRAQTDNALLFVPDVNKIARVVSFGANAATTRAAADDDRLNLSAALVVEQDDYILCLGADSAPNPIASPNYDGSEVTLYEDPVGNATSSLKYVLTSIEGNFSGWVDADRTVVDLLIQSDSGPVLVLPQYPLDPSVLPA